MMHQDGGHRPWSAPTRAFPSPTGAFPALPYPDGHSAKPLARGHGRVSGTLGSATVFGRASGYRMEQLRTLGSRDALGVEIHSRH